MNTPTLPENIGNKLKSICDEIYYPKGHILFDSNVVERSIFIIKHGLSRAYIKADGKEISIWFGQENDIIISANGYVDGRKGYETMELLEDSVLYKIDYQRLSALYHTDIEISEWARRVIEKEFVRTELHLISILSKSASERYKQFSQENPEILQRVQLRHISSYLGITSEHLSRIRSKI